MSREKGQPVAETRQIVSSKDDECLTHPNSNLSDAPKRKTLNLCCFSAAALCWLFFSQSGRIQLNMHFASSIHASLTECFFDFKTTKPTAESDKSIRNESCRQHPVLWICTISSSPGCPSAQMSGICLLDKEAGRSRCSCWCHCQPLAWAVSWKTVIRVWIGAPLLSRAHHVDVFACGGEKKKEEKKMPAFLTARVTLFCGGGGHLRCWISSQTMQVFFPPFLSRWQSVD